jgi:hypothetical protein
MDIEFWSMMDIDLHNSTGQSVSGCFGGRWLVCNQVGCVKKGDSSELMGVITLCVLGN